MSVCFPFVLFHYHNSLCCTPAVVSRGFKAALYRIHKDDDEKYAILSTIAFHVGSYQTIAKFVRFLYPDRFSYYILVKVKKYIYILGKCTDKYLDIADLVSVTALWYNIVDFLHLAS